MPAPHWEPLLGAIRGFLVPPTHLLLLCPLLGPPPQLSPYRWNISPNSHRKKPLQAAPTPPHPAASEEGSLAKLLASRNSRLTEQESPALGQGELQRGGKNLRPQKGSRAGHRWCCVCLGLATFGWSAATLGAAAERPVNWVSAARESSGSG